MNEAITTGESQFYKLLIADYIKVKRFLSRGGFAAVYVGTYGAPGEPRKPVAVKVLQPDPNASTSSEECTKMFLREAACTAHQSHTNIIRCMGVTRIPPHHPGITGLRKTTWAMVLELAEPYTMKTLITQSMTQNRRTYTDLDAFEWLSQIAEALAHLHGSQPRIIHRDVKHENILFKRMVSEQGNRGMCSGWGRGRLVAKLGDLGLHVTLENDRSVMLRRKSSYTPKGSVHSQSRSLGNGITGAGGSPGDGAATPFFKLSDTLGPFGATAATSRISSDAGYESARSEMEAAPVYGFNKGLGPFASAASRLSSDEEDDDGCGGDDGSERVSGGGGGGRGELRTGDGSDADGSDAVLYDIHGINDGDAGTSSPVSVVAGDMNALPPKAQVTGSRSGITTAVPCYTNGYAIAIDASNGTVPSFSTAGAAAASSMALGAAATYSRPKSSPGLQRWRLSRSISKRISPDTVGVITCGVPERDVRFGCGNNREEAEGAVDVGGVVRGTGYGLYKAAVPAASGGVGGGGGARTQANDISVPIGAPAGTPSPPSLRIHDHQAPLAAVPPPSPPSETHEILTVVSLQPQGLPAATSATATATATPAVSTNCLSMPFPSLPHNVPSSIAATVTEAVTVVSSCNSTSVFGALPSPASRVPLPEEFCFLHGLSSAGVAAVTTSGGGGGGGDSLPGCQRRISAPAATAMEGFVPMPHSRGAAAATDAAATGVMTVGGRRSYGGDGGGSLTYIKPLPSDSWRFSDRHSAPAASSAWRQQMSSCPPVCTLYHKSNSSSNHFQHHQCRKQQQREEEEEEEEQGDGKICQELRRPPLHAQQLLASTVEGEAWGPWTAAAAPPLPCLPGETPPSSILETKDSIGSMIRRTPELVQPIDVEASALESGLRRVKSVLRQFQQTELRELRCHSIEWVFGLTGRAGSCMYMAPEVFRKLPYNEKADVFSFGVLMYELLTRELLIITYFNTSKAARMGLRNPEDYAQRVCDGFRPPRHVCLSDAVWSLIESCWHSDPVQRPAMSEVRDQLLTMLHQKQKEEEEEEQRMKEAPGRPFASAGCTAGCVLQ